jgi:hypothetical protein
MSTKSSTKTNKENKRRSKEGDLYSVLDNIFSKEGSIIEKMDLAFGSCSSDSSSSSPSSNYSNNINYYN